MICTDADKYVNVKSTIKKETKSPALLKLSVYSTELAAVIFFVKRIYLKHQIFVKIIYFFQSTTCCRPFFKVKCRFTSREE